MSENIVGEEIVFDCDKLLDRILKMVKSDNELPSESEDHGTEACFRMKGTLAKMRQNFEMEVGNEEENLKRANEEITFMEINFKRENQECNRKLVQLEEEAKEIRMRKCELSRNLTERNDIKCKNQQNLEDLREKLNKVNKMEAVRQKMQDLTEEKRKLKMELEALKKINQDLNLKYDDSQNTIQALHANLEKENGHVAYYKRALDKVRDKQEEDAGEIMRLKECLSSEQSKNKSLHEKNEKLRKSWTKIRQGYIEMDRSLRSPSPQPQKNDVGKSNDDTFQKDVIISPAPVVKVEQNCKSSNYDSDDEDFSCAVCLKLVHHSVYVAHWEYCALRGSCDKSQSNSHKRKLSDAERIDEPESGETMPNPRTKRFLKFEESQPKQAEVTGHSAVIGEGDGEGGGAHSLGFPVAAVSEEPHPSGSKYKLRARGLSCTICQLNGKCPKHG